MGDISWRETVRNHRITKVELPFMCEMRAKNHGNERVSHYSYPQRHSLPGFEMQEEENPHLLIDNSSGQLIWQ